MRRRATMTPTGVIAAVLLLGAVLLAVWGAARPSTSLNARMQAVAAQLRCPVCQGESVADSPSQLAADMRRIIRQRLQAGQTPDQVKAYFVAKYGQWILLSPPASGVGSLAWLLPPLLIGLALLGLAALIVRWRRTQPRSWSEPDTAVERDELVVALEHLDDDLNVGAIAEDDYTTKRCALEHRLAAIDSARTLEVRPPPSSARPPRRATLTAAALLVGALVIAASLSFAVQSRGAGDQITGGAGPQTDGQVAGTTASTQDSGPRIPTDVEGAVQQVFTHPERETAWVALGTTLMNHQDYVDARRNLGYALRLAPHEVRAELELALADIFSSHERESLSLVRDVEQRHPRLSRPWLLQGLALSRLPGRQQQALAAWQRFLSLDPHGPMAARVRAWAAALRRAIGHG